MIGNTESLSIQKVQVLACQSAVLVLAAGFSSRMGSPKFALQFKEKESFLERIINVYSSLHFGQILVVINSNNCPHSNLTRIKEQYHHIQLVENQYPEKGRLHSIQLGLSKLTQPYCFIQNVDNPFITKSVLVKLLLGLKPEQILVPCAQHKNGHPIVIPERFYQNIIDETVTNTSLKILTSGFRKKRVEVDDQCILLNLNTPETYKQAFGHPPRSCEG